MSIYPYAHGCGPDPNNTIDKYWRYDNADPSTAAHTLGIVDDLLPMIKKEIAKRAKEIYHIREEAILALDLKHSVIRELAHRLNKEVIKIDRFEQENSGDIRYYHEGKSEEK